MIGHSKLGASAYTSSTPQIDLAAAKAFANPPPAVVCPADFTQEQFKTEMRTCLSVFSKNLERIIVLAEYFRSHWKDFGPTRDLACVEACGCSYQSLRNRVLYWANKVASPKFLAIDEDEINEKCLSSIEKARENGAATDVANVPQKETEPTEMPKAAPTASPAPKPEPKVAAPEIEVIKDITGMPIPKELLPFWEARQDIQDLITAASDLRCQIEDCQKANPRLFTSRYWDKYTQMQNLNSVHHQLTQVKPDVLCPECNGTLKDDQDRECGTCALTGFISKSRWHQEFEKSNTSFIKEKVAERRAML